MVAALAALLLVVVVVVAVVAVLAAGGEEPVAESEQQVEVGPEPDGDAVSLDVSVFTPPADAPGADSEGRRAAVVLAHGFGGSKASLADQAREAARAGYVVMTYTARGFGDSGGPIFAGTDSNVIVAVTSYGISSTCTGSTGGYLVDQADDLGFLATFGVTP